ncbi:MAG: ABC transporter substrate-binding protein [bacterium]
MAAALVTWPASGAWPVAVTDATGARLVFTRPPARVVSLAPSVTEVLWAVGAASQVVGVSSADDYPPEARTRPRVGGVRVDEERLAALRPDLVVGVASLQGPTLARLRSLGYQVLAVEATSLEQVYGLILLVGDVTGHSKPARQLAERMRRVEAEVAAKLRGRRPVRVFVQVWDQPFLTAGTGTLTDDLLRRAGGRNVFSERLGWPQVSEEEVVARDPECVVVLGRGAERVRHRGAWAHTTAQRTGCVAEVDPSWVVRPGPRVVLGLRALARVLHPEVRW